MTKNEARFEELKKDVQKTVGVCRQTFATRLKNLVKNHTIGYKKPFYFLSASKSRIRFDQKRLFEQKKIEKRVEGLSSHSKIFSEGYNLLIRIFRVYYLPTKFDEICSKQFYDSYEMTQCKNNNKWCEGEIRKIISTMWKRDKFFAQNVINSVELELNI